MNIHTEGTHKRVSPTHAETHKRGIDTDTHTYEAETHLQKRHTLLKTHDRQTHGDAGEGKPSTTRSTLLFTRRMAFIHFLKADISLNNIFSWYVSQFVVSKSGLLQKVAFYRIKKAKMNVLFG